MKIRLSILLLTGCCFLGGCKRGASVPRDSFQLAVQEVVSDTDVRVSLLTVQLARAATISADCGDSHSHVALPEARDGVVREGEVLLSVTRVAPSRDKSAYIQTLIRPRTTNGYAGGVSVYPVPADTALASFASISAVGGTYKLDTPITVGRVHDQPVVLVVGKPTK